MSEKLFDKKDNQIRQNGLIMSIDEVVDLLNSQSKLISAYMYEFVKINKKNEQLKQENEELISTKCTNCELINLQTRKIDSLEKENKQLKKKLECCEYEHFLNELDEIHKKVDKGDLSDFNPLKENEPLKENLYYWQCKYYRRDYEYKMDICTRCNWGGLPNYCLKDKCDKMVMNDE